MSRARAKASKVTGPRKRPAGSDTPAARTPSIEPSPREQTAPRAVPTDPSALRALVQRAIDRSRLAATHALFEIATGDEATETRRKACVDLLRLTSAEPDEHGSSPAAAVLDALSTALNADDNDPWEHTRETHGEHND